jgi:hypothetical protein
VVGKHLSNKFSINNGLKNDALSPLLFNFALECAIRKVQANQERLKLNGTHQLLVYDDDVSLLGESTYTTKKNREALLASSKENGLEVNAEKTTCMFMFCEQNAGQNHSMNRDNKSFESVAKF